MSNYDNFILQVGNVPDCPNNIYDKLCFRIAVEKIKIPAMTALLCFVLVGIMLLWTNAENQSFDWDLGAEEIVFLQDNNYYALFDD